jgi:hypothetical protein
VIEVIVLFVFRAEIGVGIDDADQFSIVLQREGVEKAGDVPVLEANDGHANGRLLGKHGG